MSAFLRRTSLSLVVPIALLVAWFWFYHVEGASNSYIVNPLDVWRKIIAIRGDLAANAFWTVVRILAGVAIGAAFGMSTAFILARWNLGRLLFAPTLNVLTAIPVIVLIPFFLIVFGFDGTFRIAVVAATAFLLVYQQAYAAVRDLSPSYFEVASIYEKSEWRIIRELLVPASLPDVVRATRFSVLFAWLAVALAEKAVAEWPNGGLGYQILRAREQGLYDELFAGVVVLGVLAYVLDYGLARFHRWVSHWQDVYGDA
jgi:sulfonate transport system permease protein